MAFLQLATCMKDVSDGEPNSWPEWMFGLLDREEKKKKKSAFVYLEFLICK